MVYRGRPTPASAGKVGARHATCWYSSTSLRRRSRHWILWIWCATEGFDRGRGAEGLGLVTCLAPGDQQVG